MSTTFWKTVDAEYFIVNFVWKLISRRLDFQHFLEEALTVFSDVF